MLKKYASTVLFTVGMICAESSSTLSEQTPGKIASIKNYIATSRPANMIKEIAQIEGIKNVFLPLATEATVTATFYFIFNIQGFVLGDEIEEIGFTSNKAAKDLYLHNYLPGSYIQSILGNDAVQGLTPNFIMNNFRPFVSKLASAYGIYKLTGEFNTVQAATMVGYPLLSRLPNRK